MAETNYSAVDFTQLPPANDGKTLLYSDNQVCQSDKTLGQLIDGKIEGKVYITSAVEELTNFYDKETINEKFASFGGFVIAEGTGEDNHPNVDNPDIKKIYLVKNDDAGNDKYCEWIWAKEEGSSENTWVLIGETSFELNLSAGTDLKYENGVMCVNTNGTVADSDDMSFVAGAGTYASGEGAFAIGVDTSAINVRSFAGGYESIASGEGTFAFGDGAIADGAYSHAEGSYTYASGDDSHAEGHSTSALGQYSHAEGDHTLASGFYSHAESNNTSAIGDCSHAEGGYTIASGYASHTEGQSTIAVDYAHAEGAYTSAAGFASHTEGQGTIAGDAAMHAGGKYNKTSAFVAFVIGNGDYNTRSDAFIVDWNGNTSAAGTLAISGISDVGAAIASINQLTTKVQELETLLESYSGRWVLTPEIPGVVIGGRKYPIVTIGGQEWIAENLDWKYGCNIGGTNPMNEPNANYLNDDEATNGVNGTKYGLKYNGYCIPEINALLTDGWRVATSSDWQTLRNYIGSNVAGKKLKSTNGWATNNGTDDYGFNGTPANGNGANVNYWGNYTYPPSDYRYFYSLNDTYLPDQMYDVGGNGLTAQAYIRLVRNAT